MSLRGKQANGLVTQQRVLRAAVAQFLEKGYTGTTTADITGAAGNSTSPDSTAARRTPCSPMRWKRRFHFLLPQRKGRQEA